VPAVVGICGVPGSIGWRTPLLLRGDWIPRFNSLLIWLVACHARWYGTAQGWMQFRGPSMQFLTVFRGWMHDWIRSMSTANISWYKFLFIARLPCWVLTAPNTLFIWEAPTKLIDKNDNCCIDTWGHSDWNFTNSSFHSLPSLLLPCCFSLHLHFVRCNLLGSD